jgi:signal transduction histidine kinase
VDLGDEVADSTREGSITTALGGAEAPADGPGAQALEAARHLAVERAARAAAEAALRRAAVLADASALLGESLVLEVVLARLAALLVPRFADWCLIDVVDSGAIRGAPGAHVDPAKRGLLAALQERHPPTWSSPHPAVRAMTTGRPVLIPGPGDERLRCHCVDEEHRRLLTALGMESGLAVPLLARGHAVGALTLGCRARRFEPADRDLVLEVARRAAVAADNAQLYRRAEGAVRLRDEFLSVASHELNTPITSLLLSAESICTPFTQARPAEMTRMALVVRRQARRLQRLVITLLEATRAEQRPFRLHRETVDLAALVREAVAQNELELRRARCRVVLDLEPVRGPWDRARLEQVVFNLLCNAWKFAPERPIEVSLAREGSAACLRVSDHGIGIDPAHRDHLFSRFARGVSADHYGGMGLGLYVCRRIVEAHGGSISVDSRPDEGATFTVLLPCNGPPDR